MNGPTMRERAEGSARRTCNPPRSTVRGTTMCAIASLDGASPNVGSLAGKKLIASPIGSGEDCPYATPVADPRLPAALPVCYVRSLDKLGDKAWLREGCDVNLRRPIFGPEAAGLAITLCDGGDRVPADPLVVARDSHCHVAADIDRNGGDIAARVGEQAAEPHHGRGELVVLKEWDAVLRHQDAARIHATTAAGIEFGAEQKLSGTDWVGRIHDDDIKAVVGRGDIFSAVVDHGFKAPIGKDRLGEFGEMLLGEFDHRGVDLPLSQALHRLMLEHLLGDAAIAAADDQHILGLAMGE